MRDTTPLLPPDEAALLRELEDLDAAQQQPAASIRDAALWGYRKGKDAAEDAMRRLTDEWPTVEEFRRQMNADPAEGSN